MYKQVGSKGQCEREDPDENGTPPNATPPLSRSTNNVHRHGAEGEEGLN